MARARGKRASRATIPRDQQGEVTGKQPEVPTSTPSECGGLQKPPTSFYKALPAQVPT